MQDCYLEYCRRDYDVRKHLLQVDDLTCPLCFGGCRFPHVDGNLKNFNHDQNKEAWRKPYHEASFLADDADVAEHMQACDLVLGAGSREVRSHCALLRHVLYSAAMHRGQCSFIGCGVFGCTVVAIQQAETYQVAQAKAVSFALSQEPTQCGHIFRAAKDVRSRTDGMYYTGRVIGTCGCVHIAVLSLHTVAWDHAHHRCIQLRFSA